MILITLDRKDKSPGPRFGDLAGQKGENPAIFSVFIDLCCSGINGIVLAFFLLLNYYYYCSISSVFNDLCYSEINGVLVKVICHLEYEREHS